MHTFYPFSPSIHTNTNIIKNEGVCHQKKNQVIEKSFQGFWKQTCSIFVLAGKNKGFQNPYVTAHFKIMLKQSL